MTRDRVLARLDEVAFYDARVAVTYALVRRARNDEEVADALADALADMAAEYERLRKDHVKLLERTPAVTVWVNP